MASDSHGSSSSRKKHYRVPTRKQPIVKCDRCHFRDMKKYTTLTDINDNQDMEFFKCPNHKPKGCDFWKWPDEYEDFLVKKGIFASVE